MAGGHEALYAEAGHGRASGLSYIPGCAGFREEGLFCLGAWKCSSARGGVAPPVKASVIFRVLY